MSNMEGIYTGNLILVNAKHPFHADAAKEAEKKRYKWCERLAGERSEEELLSLAPALREAYQMAGYEKILLARPAADALARGLAAVHAEGRIVPVSGFRSSEEQRKIYEDSLKENGEVFTRKFVAPVHCSEHETGLAIDLGEKREKIDFIRPEFPDTGVCGAFRRQADAFGFIERYQEAKENQTGIACEPWHFRYVGPVHAGLIRSHGFCLEEYIDFLRKFREGHPLRTETKDGEKAEIWFVPAEEELPVCPGDARRMEVSGNNVDGFIVTLWRR